MILASFRKFLVLGFLLFSGSTTVAVADEPLLDESRQQAVLVTGASTGIGRKVAEKLVAEGYFVYAGARKQTDLDALNAIDNIQALKLDVTVDEDIKAAVTTVRDGGRGLYGLVNNAGVLITGPMLDADVDAVKWLFDVNVLGVMRITQAFAPLIIESQGRIINMGSIAGNIASEFLGPYSMTKHAIEAYSDSLGAGMQRFGVNVSIVAPGDYSSNIWNRDIAKAKMAGVVAKDSPYYDDYQQWMDLVANLDSPPPDDVADSTLRALTDELPSRRYLIVPNVEEMSWVIGTAMTRLAELNAKGNYAYSSEELLAMLEAAIAQQK